jgi:hypothetical protein
MFDVVLKKICMERECGLKFIVVRCMDCESDAQK